MTPPGSRDKSCFKPVIALPSNRKFRNASHTGIFFHHPISAQNHSETCLPRAPLHIFINSFSWLLTDGNRGLYIPNDDRWPLHFRGLNIRIEDSICVQSEHPLVLTTEAVKEVCYFCFALVALVINLSILTISRAHSKEKYVKNKEREAKRSDFELHPSPSPLSILHSYQKGGITQRNIIQNYNLFKLSNQTMIQPQLIKTHFIFYYRLTISKPCAPEMNKLPNC